MDNYLSIGEVAKIRNINVQSLRYYEKLGILIPAYINPENNYRYYSLEQILILDTIILCIDLGIPLKELKNYVNTNGEFEFEHLLRDGKKLANEKIQKIQNNLEAINYALKHINAQKSFLNRKGYYTRYIFERSIITIPCTPSMDAKSHEKTLSRLFSIAKAQGLHATFPCGTISTYHKGVFSHSDMFLEVLNKEHPSLRMIPDGNYLCYQEPREIHSPPTSIFPQKMFDCEETTVITSSMSPNNSKYDKVILEYQILTS